MPTFIARNYDPAVSQGAKWLLSDIYGGAFTVFSNTFYVSAALGSDTSGNGSQSAPFASIGAAVAADLAAVTAGGQSGAVVVGPGTYTEAVVVASTQSNLRILAASTTKKPVIWTSATDTYTITPGATGVEIAGFYFLAPVYTANVATASIKLSNSNYAYIHDCRFQGQTGSYNAIYSPVCNSDNVRIINNDFEYFNTATNGAAILGVEAGGLSYSDWQIIGNKFSSCVTAVNINGRVCLVQGNHFLIEGITAAGALGAVTTLALDLSGTSSGANGVHGNFLGGTYSSSLYKVGATVDDWAGNFNIAGITAANPA